MSLLRFAGRSMLASYFIVSGARAIKDPASLAEDAEPFVRSVVPLAQRVTPPSVAGYIPEETASVVRLTGIAQVVGGVMVATGLGRRLGAAVLTITMIPQVVAARPRRGDSAEDRQAARQHLIKNIAILGGTLLASQDTQGRPSLAWLANDRRQRLSVDTQRAASQLSSSARRTQRRLSRRAQRLADRAAREARFARRELSSQSTIAKQQAQLGLAKAQARAAELQGRIEAGLR